jgi:hypothetical protein
MLNGKGLVGIDFVVSGVRHLVEVPDAATGDAVRSMFPAYAAGPVSSAPRDAALRVERTESAWLITSAVQSDPVVSATFNAFVDDCEYCLTEIFLQGCADVVQLHASGWATDAGAVLVLGPSGAGKSSLATQANLNGLAAFGDDLVLIGDDRKAAPFKRLFKSDPELLRRLGWDPAGTVFWDPESEEAWFDPARAGGWAEPASVRTVAVVRFGAGEPLAVEERSAADGLSLLVHSCFETGLGKAEAFSRLTGLVEGASVLEVRFGDGEEAVRALSEWAPR